MVIQLVLKHPHIFVFGELLEIESVKQLATSEYRAWYDVLKVFAYGTYGEYVSTPGLPPLGEVEVTKLKQLTLVNMASKQRILPYAALQSALAVRDLRALEDLIIECIYLGLIEGHLNQKDSSLEITSAMGRDIGPTDVQSMIDQLAAWLNSTDVVLGSLRGEVARVHQEEEEKRKDDIEQDEKKARVMEEIKVNKLVQGASGGAAAGMDDGIKRKKPTKGGIAGLFGRGR